MITGSNRNLHVPEHPADVCHNHQAPAAQQARLVGHHLLSPGSQGPAVGGPVVEGAKRCNPRGSPRGPVTMSSRHLNQPHSARQHQSLIYPRLHPRRFFPSNLLPTWRNDEPQKPMLRCYFNCYQLPLTRLLTWKGVRSRDFGTKAFSKTWTYWRPKSLDQGFWEFMNVCQCLVATGSKNKRLAHCGKIGAIFLEVLCRKVYGVYMSDILAFPFQ